MAIAAEQSSGEIVVSSITAWELALLVRRGKLTLGVPLADWLATAGHIPSVRFAPVDNAIAVDSVDLPGAFHADLADRIIVATARRLGAGLVTADERIRAYSHVRTIW